MAPPLELRLSMSSSGPLGDSGVPEGEVPAPPPACSAALRSTESPGCRLCWEERGCSVMMSAWGAGALSAPTTAAGEGERRGRGGFRRQDGGRYSPHEGNNLSANHSATGTDVHEGTAAHLNREQYQEEDHRIYYELLHTGLC